MSEDEKTSKQPEKSSRTTQEPLIEFSFNSAVKIKQQPENISANTGVLILREIDHLLGLTNNIAAKMNDPRDSDQVRYSLAELLRERIYAIALGYSRQDDTDILAHDPAFKTAVWEKSGSQTADERLASQPTASRLVSLLAEENNLQALRESLSLPIARHQQADGGDARVSLGVVDPGLFAHVL
jgi:hypothetical protein